MIMTTKRVKLRYADKQPTLHGAPLRMWNIMTEGHAFYKSTRTLEGLIELKIVPAKYIKFVRMGRT